MDNSKKVLFILVCLIFIVYPLQAMLDIKRNIPGEKEEPDALSKAFIKACINGDVVTAQSLIASGANVAAVDERGDTALALALSYNQKEILELLIERGVDLDMQDEQGSTLLHTQIEFVNYKGAKWLIRNGADVNAKTPNKSTPLHLVADDGWSSGLEVVKLLIEFGAQINVKDSAGSTPLHEAAIWTGPYPGNVKFLLKKGAEAHCENNFGVRPLMIALYAGNYTNVLLLLSMPEEKNIQEKIFKIFAAEGDCPELTQQDIMNKLTSWWLEQTKELIAAKDEYFNKNLIEIAQQHEENCMFGRPSELLSRILAAKSFRYLGSDIAPKVEKNIQKAVKRYFTTKALDLRETNRNFVN